MTHLSDLRATSATCRKSFVSQTRAFPSGQAFRIVVLSIMVLCLPKLAAARQLPPVTPVRACASLGGMVLTNPQAPGFVDSAKLSTAGFPVRSSHAAGATRPPIAPYCDVKGYVAGQVRFEIWLPTTNWTQRMLFFGCGNYCGAVRIGRPMASEGCIPVTRGEFAIVTSDLGHETVGGITGKYLYMGNTVWAANKDLRIDFAYRGVHVTTLAAKEIIARFYGRPQAYAYFDGCSDGGREAVMEAERYPADYNGIIAGSPLIGKVETDTVVTAWMYQKLRKPDGSAVFSDAQLETLHAAVIAACRENGRNEFHGVLIDPTKCDFNPESISCKAGESGNNCLTPVQVRVAKDVYTGPQYPDGTVIAPGFEYGSELRWNRWLHLPGLAKPGGFPGYLASDPPNPKVSYANLQFTREAVKRQRVFVHELDPMNADLRPFENHGGKLIIWDGWTDPHTPPMFAVNFVRKVHQVVGPSTNSFLRLYMLPGVNHCGGGLGPDKLDAVSAIMAWVEDRVAPEAMKVTKKNSTGKTIEEEVVEPYE